MTCAGSRYIQLEEIHQDVEFLWDMRLEREGYSGGIFWSIVCYCFLCKLWACFRLQTRCEWIYKSHLPTIRRNHGWKDVRGHSKCTKLEIYKITGDSHSQNNNNKKNQLNQFLQELNYTFTCNHMTSWDSTTSTLTVYKLSNYFSIWIILYDIIKWVADP